MRIPDLTLTVRFPDVRPADVHLLHDVAEALPDYGADDLRAGLINLSDRIARMILLAKLDESP